MKKPGNPLKNRNNSHYKIISRIFPIVSSESKPQRYFIKSSLSSPHFTINLLLRVYNGHFRICLFPWKLEIFMNPSKSLMTDTRFSPPSCLEPHSIKRGEEKENIRKLKIINYCSWKNFEVLSSGSAGNGEAIKGHLSKFNHFQLGELEGWSEGIFF